MAKIEEYDLLQLFDKFISDSQSGRRLQKNGKRLSNGTLQNYRFVRKHLYCFSLRSSSPLRIRSSPRLNKRMFAHEKKYWAKFYKQFTDYLYKEVNCFDNYVGSNIKILRTFFTYLSSHRGFLIGSFHKDFYVHKEHIPLVVLAPEQLNFLIFNREFEEGLSERLIQTKDIFVFGCTVALRVSDLFNLRRSNLESIGEHSYLKVLSKKTQTFTRVKLPEYAVDILKRYQGKKKNLLPKISLFNLNKNIRLLMESAGWTQPFTKIRTKRGIRIFLKNERGNTELRFCDLVSSHTMRRTAITTMLSLGMPEYLVRKISGHSANSPEFFRYVALAQFYIDHETQNMFEKLEQKILHPKGEKMAKTAFQFA